MRITNETEYSLRIMHRLALAGEGGRLDARTLSEELGVPPRFTLKILRKLMGGGLVKSYKGASGGYSLAAPAADITVRAIVETIEGPLTITRCLDENCACGKPGMDGSDKTLCYFHRVMAGVNRLMAEELEKANLADAVAGDIACEIRGERKG